MRIHSFAGGVHPRETLGGKRVTGAAPVVDAMPPATVAIALSQHVGAPCRPLVKPGDTVLMGQKVGEPTGLGAPVHSPVSGTVKGIKQRTLASGVRVDCVIIENDGRDSPCSPLNALRDPLNADIPELLAAVREAGLVGLGGAAFPTHVKLSPPKDKKIEYLLINGAECEPYLTGDHRMMVEKPQDVIDGARIAARILGAEHVKIGVERNKPDAISALKAHAGKYAEVCRLRAKYPQGGEKQLIRALTGRRAPSGGLPMDVGCVVLNVSTAAQLAVSLRTGMPLISRVVTVTGLVKKPCNLRVRVGTDIGSVIEQAGGALPGADRVILGGPMMGTGAYNLNTPVMKATGGVLLLGAEKPPRETSCIRCASCVRACPMGLMPLNIYALGKTQRFAEAAAREHALDCMECGACAYGCPAKLPLVHMIRVVKRAVKGKRG